MREDPERILRDIGQRVAEVRVERDWTQERFAEELGVTTNYVQRIERGGQNLTIHRLVWLAAALGVSFMDLLTPPTGGPRRRSTGTQRRAGGRRR